MHALRVCEEKMHAKILQVKNIRSFLLQSVTLVNLGTVRWITGLSTPLQHRQKVSCKIWHNHINLEHVNGVANPVVVDLSHGCTKSHQLKEYGILFKLLVTDRKWVELKSTQFSGKSMQKYALIKRKLKHKYTEAI